MTQIARKFNKVISLGVKFPICKLNQSIFRVTVDLIFCALRASLRDGRKRIRGSHQASSLAGL